MKIFKITLLSAFIIMGTLTSCEDNTVIYDPDTGQTLAFFSEGSSDLAVLIGESSSLTIELGVSTLSSSDRTVAISVDPNSTADPQNYMVPSSVTIPANEFFGYMEVTGIDNTVETTAESIIINIGTVDGAEVAGNASHTISIFQVCPVPSDYLVGDYAIEDVVAIVGPGNGTENFESGVITIEVDPDEATSRVFTVGVLPAFAGSRAVKLTLVCNTLILGDVVPGLTCDGVSAYIFTDAGANNSSYTISDDSSFLINYIEDPFGSCGGPFEASLC